MCTLYVRLCIIIILLDVTCSLACETIDRKYNCDYIVHPNNRTVVSENDKQFNASSNGFLHQYLQYCKANYFCRPEFRQIDLISHLMCFSDNSCLFDREVTKSCTCMHLRELREYNIMNDASQVGIYFCIRVGPGGLNIPYCLKDPCRSFTAIEKLCTCHYQSWNCTCSSYCEDLVSRPPLKTYALFFSFGDVYVTREFKSLDWFIFGLISFLITCWVLFLFMLCTRAVGVSPIVRNARVLSLNSPQMQFPPAVENHINARV